MRVGYTASDPWVVPGGSEPQGIEPELVRAFAESIDAEIGWFEGSEAELMEALEFRELDLVIGGLTATNPWSSKVALTHPYVTTQVVVAAPQGEPIPKDIAGLPVAVEEGTSVAGVLAKTDADVTHVSDVTHAEGAVAVDNWLLDDLGLTDTGVTLEEHDHVLAVPMGENALLVKLERFLLGNEDLVTSLLERQEP